MAAPATPRKKPAQARSLATWNAVLEAAAHILRSEGARALTTNSVAERAGVSIGSLYQYFPSKDAIIAELVREMKAAMVRDFATVLDDAALCAAPLPKLVGAIMRASLLHHSRDPELARRLETIEQDMAVDADLAALKAGLTARFVQLLRGRGVPRAEQAVRDLTAMSMGLSHAALLAGEDDFEDLAARLTRAALGYLGIAPGP
ncbi:TetR/AcrR family transcriptional regulator [Vannielia litorea]|uniref:Transcriptional regulator, TetR family n=1 Tax=Vannielia litorea TaxID=1217970 RepID=A0A1N6E8B9_9RHOB|nr:TetR/AcrR family transcriptional regulator [Vannielia litorea]SIN79262.1 transcriptional regulator, TetR family [Vannielia litorea]